MCDSWFFFSWFCLLFEDDVVLCWNLQLSLEGFAAKRETVGVRKGTYKSDIMVLGQERVECTLKVGDENLPEGRR